MSTTLQNTERTITVSRSAALTQLLRQRSIEQIIPTQRDWRKEDPPSTTVGDLSPEDFGGRVVIRSGDFLGTVIGLLLDAHAHPSLVKFTTVHLLGKKPLTFRNDLEVIVVDDLQPRDFLVN